jgi:Leucine-rich repeat (LRR) protein
MVCPQLCGASMLATVNLSNNHLAELPTDIGNLRALVSLFVYNNQLRTLPESVLQLTALKQVWFCLSRGTRT